jgi:type IX secretion system substrate protein
LFIRSITMHGTFIIETNSSEQQILHIYDINGKLVLTQSINGKTDIDARSLNEGIYNISIISDESVINKKLVIVK